MELREMEKVERNIGKICYEILPHSQFRIPHYLRRKGEMEQSEREK